MSRTAYLSPSAYRYVVPNLMLLDALGNLYLDQTYTSRCFQESFIWIKPILLDAFSGIIQDHSTRTGRQGLEDEDWRMRTGQ